MPDDFAPDVQPDPGAAAASQAVQTLALNDDASAYVEERKDQQANDRGEEAQRPFEDRLAAIREAREKARTETSDARLGPTADHIF
jgi:hypothetical protein